MPVDDDEFAITWEDLSDEARAYLSEHASWVLDNIELRVFGSIPLQDPSE